ncbi:MAG: hypothetical protein ACFB10_13010, partial [Salibacteraceae bacterium]
YIFPVDRLWQYGLLNSQFLCCVKQANLIMKSSILFIFSLVFSLLVSVPTLAQDQGLSQTVRGRLLDKQSQVSLLCVDVVVISG